MSWPAFQGLIFDVDGTLYRQRAVRLPMAARLLTHCLAKPAAALPTLRLIREYRRMQERLRDGGAADDQFRLACKRARVDSEWGARTIREWIQERPLDLIAGAAFPGLVPLLQQAAGRGLRLGVFSDYPPQEKLEALGISRFFSSVLSAADPRVGVFKPHPKGILTVLADLELSPSRALYIGDRPEIDGEAARRAGTACAIIGAPARRSGDGWRGVPNYATLANMLAF